MSNCRRHGHGLICTNRQRPGNTQPKIGRIKMSETIAIHPSVDKGVTPAAASFAGGTLVCKCAQTPVKVTVKGQIAYDHACGCTKCRKPAGAVFSLVAVTARDNLSPTENSDKLAVVDPSAAIQRYACKGCEVHMYGRIENKKHPF